MGNNKIPNIIICSIIIGTLVIFHILSNILRLTLGGETTELSLSQLVDQHAKEYAWILKLMVNCFGYSCVFVPGVLIYKYTTATKYLDRAALHGEGKSCIPNAVRFCLTGSDTDHQNTSNTKSSSLSKTTFKDCILLSYCFIGLMVSYLTWGVLQEKIMTKEYENIEKKKSYFKDSQFLVFTNRLLAFIIAAICLWVKSQTKQRVPFYKYSYASVSNIMSAWFQYEALKFISFPTQVLAKSCKIIPVMIMGKIMSRNKYEFYEYLTAGLITIGMIFFLTGSTTEGKTSSVTTLTGIFLLILYMIFDSFTSNWQGDLFKTYSMTSIQMMCGVNLFSTLFTLTSLIIQGGFMESLKFAIEHSSFVTDCIILSLSSAIGQLFIFFTIATFGPVIFTIIMTIRQASAILLSCLIYKHEISFLGILGVSILFLAIFLRVYCNQRLKSIRIKKAELIAKSRVNV